MIGNEKMPGLEKRDCTRAVDSLPRGIIDPRGSAARIRVSYYTPSPPLASFIDHHWIVEWDLTGRPSEKQRALPSPNAHLVVGPGQSALFGIVRGAYCHTLAGSGRVLGLRFRTGGLRPFLDGPVAKLTDRTLPVSVITGLDDASVEHQILGACGNEAMVYAVEALVEHRLPPLDPTIDEVCAIVRRARRDGGPLRVDALADDVGLSLRTLQRLFRDYVGISPKWVIRRYRLQEAAQRLAKGQNVKLADLAAELGYFDQAHLAYDFTRLFGCSPSNYRRTQIN
jgi:AraC-like DNA-binding protein